MEDTTEIEPAGTRQFPLDVHRLMMAERLYIADEFGINIDSLRAEISERIAALVGPERMGKEIDDLDTATKIKMNTIYEDVFGPKAKFALLTVAVKRRIPSATPAEVLDHMDADGVEVERWEMTNASSKTPTTAKADADPFDGLPKGEPVTEP